MLQQTNANNNTKEFVIFDSPSDAQRFTRGAKVYEFGLLHTVVVVQIPTLMLTLQNEDISKLAGVKDIERICITRDYSNPSRLFWRSW